PGTKSARSGSGPARAQPQEALEVALGAGDRRVGPRDLREPEAPRGPRDVVDGLGADRLGADHAALAEPLRAHLELRLHHAEDLAAGLEDVARRREELLEADEARVDDHQIDPLREALGREVTRVGALHDHDAG